MNKPVRYALILLLLSAAVHPFSIFSLDGSYDRLYAEFWYELDPIRMEDFTKSAAESDKKQGIREMLQEAQFIFSGMIYGYTILYTPSDSARQVAEILQIEPAAQIPWGDPGLRVESTRIDGDKLYAVISYTLQDFQKFRLKSWAANTFPGASGTGKGDYFKGAGGKLTSYKNAIKEAVRAYLRKRIYNKPKEIKARIILTDPPRCIADAGYYLSTVKIKMQIDELLPYTKH